MLRKIIACGILLVLCISVFAACGGNKYNAAVVVSGLVFKSEFLKENMTYGAHYENEDYNENDESGRRILIDQTSPEYRTYIITKQDQIDEIFTIFPSTDFEKEIVVMYAYTDVGGLPNRIQKIKLDENILTVAFKAIKPSSCNSVYNAAAPQQRFFIVKLDKLELSAVEFIRS